MQLILTSPPLMIEEVTRWTRNLLDSEVLIDNSVIFKVVDIVQFQTVIATDIGFEPVRVMVLVKLFGPVRKEVENSG